MRVKIGKTWPVARQAKALTLEPPGGARLPTCTSGSHVEVRIPNGESLGAAPFSLTGSPLADSYEIVVSHDLAEDLLSAWLYEEAAAGDDVYISQPRCGLPLDAHAASHCLIAGGSGITAFLSHLHTLRGSRCNYQLHYCVREKADYMHHDALALQYARHVRVYVSGEGRRLSIGSLLSSQPNGTHVYVCGPSRLIQAVVDAAKMRGFPPADVHWDRYGWAPQLPSHESVDFRVASA